MDVLKLLCLFLLRIWSLGVNLLMFCFDILALNFVFSVFTSLILFDSLKLKSKGRLSFGSFVYFGRIRLDLSCV